MNRISGRRLLGAGAVVGAAALGKASAAVAGACAAAVKAVSK